MPRVFKPSSNSVYGSKLCADLNKVLQYEVIPETCSAPLKFRCNETCVGGNTTWLSNYVSRHGEDEVPLGDIDRLLALICCSKHISDFKASLKGLHIGTDHDNSNHLAGKPTPQVCFGSKDYENTDQTFSFSVSGQASEPPSVDDSQVSKTRQLKVFSDGQKEVHPVDPEAASPATPLTVSRPVDHEKSLVYTPTRGSARLKSKTAGDAMTPSASPSLSPNETRSPNRNRSESRIRTPSPGTCKRLDNHGRSLWATMRGDVSYENPPEHNQKSVLELIRAPLRYKDGEMGEKKGRVYVVRAPELELVKIGFTTGDICARVRQIESQCRKSSEPWQIEHDPSNSPIVAYRRLEKLVHQDLAPHRWFFRCGCGSNSNASGYTEHQEWFDVSPEIAIKTIKLWRSFLLQDPYGEPLKNTVMQLEGPWIDRLKEYKEAGCNEKHEDHETRLDRWRQLLGIGDPHEPNRVPKQEGMEASITKIKSEPKDEDLATIFTNVPQKAPEDLPIPSIEPPTVAEPPKWAPEMSADLVDGRQTPNSRGHEATSQTTPSSGEAPPSASASAAALDDLQKTEMQNEDSKRDHMSKHNLRATPRGVIHGEEFLKTLTAVLNHKRPAIPERTIMDDLTALRWPLGCAIAFALHTPYVPPVLSAMLWTVFLPFLVAELRGWML
ncbi:hypothetical protein KC357_g4562 [Hortaea werneckii]|nr:hypothetical protein KC357_g4562 [Hortaea werneckii]